MSEHTPLTEAERRREARKFGTETPHEPTDEFVRRAFAEGAKSLWPDSRDPGWCVTFDRWLAARTSTATADTGLRERVEAAARAGRRATLDPGAFVKRGRDADGDYERLDLWQERALIAAVDALDATAPTTGARE